MNVLLFEDELSSAERMTKMIKAIDSSITILGVIETVEEGIKWFKNNSHPDLIIADIQLSDGLSFEILKTANTNCNVIFTTAYNEYAIEAFKVNSIDYLLKPIDKDELEKSIQKHLKLQNRYQPFELLKIQELMNRIQEQKTSYKSRFLVKHRQSFLTVFVDDIMFFYIEDQLVFLMTKESKKFLIEQTLNELEILLNPSLFFRINRQMIISIHAVKKIDPYFNNRLIIESDPLFESEIIVSREKVNDFKKWIEK